ncbi:hypothetical protein [Parasitella parasitica]|uniref:Telomerase reverse transcriptase n=1 Tax=Parasitella parasitica TaxID=35722 RepID=A0A0B7NPF3_9FUNG|nr:hypothetical protein [Parasitella parasitica]
MAMIPNYFSSIFKSVQTLQEYLGLDIDELDIPLDDKNALNELSQQILIAIRKPNEGIFECPTEFTPPATSVSAAYNIEDMLVDICVYVLSHWQLSNVLTSGCALAPDRNSIRMKYNNTILNQILTSKAWNVLFHCVKKQNLYDLFLSAIILHRLPNGAYYQLSGTPLSLRNVTLEPKKHKKSPDSVDQYMSTFLFDIASHHKDLPRYLDSLLLSKKRRKPTGCSDQPNKVQKLSRRQKKKLKHANTAVVSKSKGRIIAIDRSQLFYCQNNINPSGHVVMKLPKDHMLKRGKSSDLNDEFIVHCMSKIFPREFTTPNKIKKFLKRSQLMQEIVKELHNRHNKVQFLQILNKRCPQKSLNSNITRTASRHFEVFELIKEIVRRAFPIKFWGSKDNFDVICKAIKHLISRRKSEKLSMTEIMHKIKVLDCQWLSSSHKQRVVPSDLQRRKMILQQAFTWFFNDFIMPTLKSFFYITEHAKFGKQTFYYRRDTWQSLTEPRIQSLVEADYFEEMHGTEIGLQLAASKIRFLPKENGLRMITNMNNTKKLTQGHAQVDTDDKLGSLLDILHFEKDRNPDLMGSSVLGRHLLYKRFKSYTKKVLPTKSKFYFVKVDISNCFDNIDQYKLLHILEGVLQSGQYLGRQVSSARPFSDKIMRRSFQAFSTTDTTSEIDGYVGRLTDVRPGSIVVDQFGTKHYKRCHGIAQGSRLSTLLCSFFLGRLEQDKLAYLKQDEDGVLFTYIDDFLYITKNKDYAVRFLDTMTKDIFDFSVSVNKDKCLTNIYSDIAEFTWLGLIFDTKTLNVHIDKSARKKSDVTSSLTVEYSRQPSALLLNSGVRAIKSKLYDILMDSEINSKQSLARNLTAGYTFGTAWNNQIRNYTPPFSGLLQCLQEETV